MAALFNGAELRQTLVGLALNPAGTLTTIPWRPFSPGVLSSLDKRVIIAPNPGGVDQQGSARVAENLLLIAPNPGGVISF